MKKMYDLPLEVCGVRNTEKGVQTEAICIIYVYVYGDMYIVIKYTYTLYMYTF